MGTTVQTLIEKLGSKGKGQYVSSRNQTLTIGNDGIVAYLKGQSSLKATQNFISAWSRNDYFSGFLIKYQLEIQSDDMQRICSPMESRQNSQSSQRSLQHGSDLLDEIVGKSNVLNTIHSCES